MEVMNYLLLGCALHSMDLIIIDVEANIELRRMTMYVGLEGIKDSEFIPSQAERCLEYGKLLIQSLKAVNSLDQKKNYTFTFEFCSNGVEHCTTSPIAEKLKDT